MRSGRQSGGRAALTQSAFTRATREAAGSEVRLTRPVTTATLPGVNSTLHRARNQEGMSAALLLTGSKSGMPVYFNAESLGGLFRADDMDSPVSFAAPTMPRTSFPLEITWTFSEPVGGGTLQGAIAVAIMEDECVHPAMQVSEQELLELLTDTRLPHMTYWSTNALAAALEGRPPADNFLFLRLEAEATGELICQEIFVGNGAGADLASVSRNFPAKHNFYNERLATAHREDAASEAPSQEPVAVEDMDVVQKCKVVLRVILRVSGRCAAFRVRPGGEILVPSRVTAKATAVVITGQWQPRT